MAFFMRQLGILIIGLVIWFGGMAYVEKVTQTDTAFVDGVIFVDRFSATNKTTGTIDAPYKNITDALAHVRHLNSPTTVILAPGIYTESFRLPTGTTLTGTSAGQTIIINDGTEHTIYLEDRTALLNLTIRGGEHVLFIPAHTKTTIVNTIIEDSRRFGIFTEKSTRITFTLWEEITGKNTEKKDALSEESQKILRALPLISLSNVTVQNNKNQGLYLQDARVEIKNSLIENNGEEGIDLHPNMHATIMGNTVRKNGESGLETEIQNNTVLLTNNIFEKNGTNGVAFNSADGIGDMTLVGNTFVDNKNFGIRCVRQTDPPKKPRPFFPTLIDQRSNTFKDNGEKDFSFHCSEF